ncbi:ABC-2 transporter permease [Paenibacillus polygoni]|uniref:ABC-2 transporter permease n=1 Tax=Paenibacillus polygoni TaxID=3050112 RepID=A0ABY8X3N1_9BACL|nr:ABC-2 transporter permease [Paenibacillus polygoni]WIV19638.1 ABC-2 transporter permease [Paenibacillus polygoni]
MNSTMWKQAWWLTKTGLKRDRLNWIWTILFTLYTAAITGSFLTGTGLREMEAQVHTIVADNIFLLFVPFLGFFFTRRSLHYIQNDSYTQMLSYMRRLPIPASIIIWSRILQMMVAFAVNSVIFFTLIYFLVLRAEHFRFDQVLAFSLIWIGYGIIANAFYIYWEFVVNGKAYFILGIVSFIAIFLIALTAAILDWNLILFSIEHSQQWGLLAPGMWIMLVSGILLTIFSFKRTKKKMLVRDVS